VGFVLDGLETEAYDRKYGDRELVGRIIDYFRPHKRKMLLVGIALTLNSAAGTGGPILISRAIDSLLKGPQAEVIWLLAAGVLLLDVAAWVGLISSMISATFSTCFPIGEPGEHAHISSVLKPETIYAMTWK